MSTHDRTLFASSTGQQFTDTGHLDAHFEANRADYEELLRMAGFERGWHVLDAGCGGGNFLPWIAEIVGSEGAITALDLAPENIELTRRRVDAWRLPCPVESVVGSVLDLPFADNHVDGVWCANTTQYLTDDELDTALAEFRRVTRPGGLVAVKEIDMSLMRLRPSNPSYLWRAHERGQSWNRFPGSWRGWNLRRLFERAGLEQTWAKSTLIERRAPLSSFQRESIANFVSGVFAPLHARLAEESGAPAEEIRFWADLRDDTADSILNHPDFYMSEGQVLAVGRVPVDEAPRSEELIDVGLQHVSVPVPAGQVDDARAFYGELLGLEEIPRRPEVRDLVAWYRLGSSELHLIGNPDWLPPREHPEHPQAGPHIALVVNDLAALRGRLDAQGVATEDPLLPIEGRIRFYCRDPFGNLIEVVQMLSKAAR